MDGWRLRTVPWRHRWPMKRVLAAAMGTVMTVSIAVGIGATPAAAGTPWLVSNEPSVSGKTPAVPPPEPDPAEVNAVRTSPKVTWPAPGAAELTLASDAPAARADNAPRALAGGLPVRVGSPTSAASTKAAVPGKVRIELSRRYEDGLLLRLNRTDGVAQAGPVSLDVDYSAFRNAYGGDWAVRLRAVSLPECALSTPELPECVGTPLYTTNNGSGRLTADVTVGGDQAVLGKAPGTGKDSGSGFVAIIAGSSSGAGDFKASSLAPSATWTMSGSSGDFSWSYPMEVPPSLSGPEPDLELAYSSGNVDGRTSATNNQPSWVGEGFEFSPGGYIERRYRNCGQDTTGGNNVNHKTGDLCYATDNAILTLNGRGGELVRDDATRTWHPRTDDGSKVERLLLGPNVNGDNDGEYWKITTRDGTQYFFGLHKLPGWANTTNTVTNSVWTVPVFGNQSTEPCYKSTFDLSYCDQAWRWNLDYVVDPHGNTMSLFYQTETNYYARNMTSSKVSKYIRGGWLDHTEYGQLKNEVYSTPAVAKVNFTTADRCIPGTTCTSAQPLNWPDTPWDQACSSATSCPNKYSPTFWTQKRLDKVTTQVANGTSFRNVDSWTLSYTYADPEDGTRFGLWLDKIHHTGWVGGQADLPDVSLFGIPMHNRVDGHDNIPPMNWYRIHKIQLDSGGELTVDYSNQECAPGALPVPDSNTKRCHPLRWTPEGADKEQDDWFHKYVVTQVTENDRTTGLPEQLTQYEYASTPAWHHDDEDGLVPEERKSWSQWRGYDKIRMRQGPVNGLRTTTESVFFRGMDGDQTTAGPPKQAFIVDSAGGRVPDSEPLAGMEREQLTYTNGSTIQERSITDPWLSTATATRVSTWGTTRAFQLEEAKVRQSEATGTGAFKDSSSDNVYDSRGVLQQSTDFGDVSDPNDDTCTRYTYGNNEESWILELPSRIETVGVACDKTPTYPDDLLDDEKIYYDGSTTLGAAPVRGDVTRRDELSGWVNGAPTFVTALTAKFDVHGREIESIDAKSAKTTTDYTPATRAPVTSTTVTNALNHRTITAFEPAWGEELSITDPNDRVTQLEYDPLGRLARVWQPGRTKSQNPDTRYSYTMRTNGANAVMIETLQPDGSYETEYELYDGMMRPRQTQEPAVGGGRIVTDTTYDSRGLEVKHSGPFHNDAPPGPDVLTPDDATLPAQTITTYDDNERPREEIFLIQGVEQWRTTHTYGQNWHSIDPPDGDTPTTTYLDTDGRTTELRQYQGDSPTGAYDSTRYTYNKRGQQETITDSSGNVWRYRYNLAGDMVHSEDPDRGPTDYTFNAAHEKVTATDSRDITLVYGYDILGRQTEVREGSMTGPKRAGWTYDTVADGSPAKGEETSAIRYDNGSEYTVSIIGFDSAGRSKGTRYTLPGAEGKLARTYEFTSTYAADGELATLAQPEVAGLPGETLTLGYSADGMANTLTGASPYVTKAGYSLYGELQQIDLSAGVASGNKKVSLKYDYEFGTHRLAHAVVERNDTAKVANVGYGYDDAGNVTKIADSPDASTGQPAETQCFGTDYLRRLTAAWTPKSGDCGPAPSASGLGGPAPYWHQWTFDKSGNRRLETRTEANGATTTSTYTYPDAGQAQPHTLRGVTTTGAAGSRTDSYEYDATGNTRTRTVGSTEQTMTWDAEGHVASVTAGGATTRFLYDADGNRLLRRDTSGTTLYLGDTEVHLAPDGTLTGTRYYSFVGRTVAVRTSSDNKLNWLALDHHGTPEIAIDATTQQVYRRRFTPYGEERGAAPAYWPGEKSFVGGTADPSTGLIHIGARDYDPSIGRFISVDPIVDYGDPQQANGYAYANNNPVSYLDADGQWGFITSIVHASKTVVRTVVHTTVNTVKFFVSMPVMTQLKNGAKKVINKTKEITKKVIRKTKKTIKKVVKFTKKVTKKIKQTAKKAYKAVKRAYKRTEHFVKQKILRHWDPFPNRKHDEPKRAVPRPPDPTSKPPNDSKVLFRFGGPKNLEEMQAQAEQAEKGGFGYGVSTLDRLPKKYQDDHGWATVGDLLNAGFGVKKTGKNPHHYTVTFPRKLDEGMVARFNALFYGEK